MIAIETTPLGLLYEQDETAWLDAMSRLAAEGRFEEMDLANLAEYLGDMARRDRREVFSRLRTLLVHLLKWDLQPSHRSSSWESTIFEQRSELKSLLESGVLLRHAQTVLADAHKDARKQASIETDLALETFPVDCPWDLDQILDRE